MKKKIKDRWLKALRSRKYKQAVGKLKDGDSYCCLGVLSCLYINSKTGKKNNARWGDDGTFVSNLEGGENSILPIEVMDWAGLELSDPIIGNCHNTPCEASDHNDSGYKFYEIARKIERNL